MDAYLCLVHLTAALVVEQMFSAFAAVAITQFLLFAVAEMRLLLVVWRAQRPPGADDSMWSLRRELGMLYARFYMLLLLGEGL